MCVFFYSDQVGVQLTQDAVSMLSASLYLVGNHERLGTCVMCKCLVVRIWQAGRELDVLMGLEAFVKSWYSAFGQSAFGDGRGK